MGPVCDFVIDDDPAQRKIIVDDGDGRVYTYGPLDFSAMESVFGAGTVPAIIARRCKVRELEDGTLEYYDCVDDLLSPIPGSDGGLGLDDYDWKTKSQIPWGLDDDFENPTITSESCSPHDPDINIIPIRVFNPDGSFVTKTQVERSSPVTFNVTSEDLTVINNATITAEFSEDRQNLVIGGTGDGIVQLRLTWKDDPGISGQAIGTLTVAGASFSQGNNKRGDVSRSVQVTAGQSYPIVLSGNSGTSGSVRRSAQVIEYDDDIGNGFDLNATFQITDILPLEPTTNVEGYWSEEGNSYGVWVNPAVCTLPFQQQDVTYQIDIPETGTYGFEFACDDNAQMFLNGSSTPFMSITGGIFEGGTYNTPYTATTTLNAGTLTMVVKCTNSAAGFVDANGQPEGLAYSWQRNPGGWYVKICQGGGCVSPTTIQWVESGPHPAWSNFMNTYAVFADNQDTLSGTTQNATWNLSLVDTGNYELEVQADNQAVISFDGTTLGTVNSFTTSTTYTLNNITSGGHTLAAAVTNNVETVDVWSNNPAGVAWTLKKLSALSNITAKFNNSGDLVVTGQGTGTVTLNYAWDETPEYSSANVSLAFDSNGNLVATGTGTATVELLFEWDDNPSFAGQALGTLTWSNLTGASFTQTSGVRKGSDDDTVTVTAGTTYNISIANGTGYGGFSVQDNGQKLCFRDLDGNDCNAQVVIGSITQGQTEVASDRALTSYSVNGYTFTTGSANTGTSNATFSVNAGTTYPATIVGNPNGFTLKQSKTKLCFQDSSGTDCNASVTIGDSNNSNADLIVANSTQLNTPGGGNIIWHTRLASGYKYTTV